MQPTSTTRRVALILFGLGTFTIDLSLDRDEPSLSAYRAAIRANSQAIQRLARGESLTLPNLGLLVTNDGATSFLLSPAE